MIEKYNVKVYIFYEKNFYNIKIIFVFLSNNNNVTHLI